MIELDVGDIIYIPLKSPHSTYLYSVIINLDNDNIYMVDFYEDGRIGKDYIDYFDFDIDYKIYTSMFRES